MDAYRLDLDDIHPLMQNMMYRISCNVFALKHYVDWVTSEDKNILTWPNYPISEVLNSVVRKRF